MLKKITVLLLVLIIAFSIFITVKKVKTENDIQDVPKDETTENNKQNASEGETSQNGEQNIVSSYKCQGEKQDITFAIVETFYLFDYKYSSILNTQQIYSFKFTTEDYYNQFDQEKLFPNSVPKKVEYHKEDLTKDFIFETAIPMNSEIKNEEQYISLVKQHGYNCIKLNQ